jgi:hypothetical protein
VRELYNSLSILVITGMPSKTCPAWLFATLLAMMAGGARGQSPAESLLVRFQEKVRQDMTNIPNYTCLETIERAHREPHARGFKPVDTVRLEVSSVAGKELFAWPGARQFEDRDVTSLVTGGAIGTGMFANFARNLFVTGKGDRRYGGEENLAGRSAVRYDFHLMAQESSFQITSNNATEIVAAKGAFWFDSGSLDLIRLDVYGDGLPYSLRLEEAVIRTFYARTHIGDSDALLPKRSELTMSHFSGEANRDAIEFSQCHEYRTESTISFDAPPATLPEAPKPQVREVNLPAGLLIPVELDAAIDSKTASVGDTLHARVVEEVRLNRDLAVPRGAAVTGHIRKLDRGSARAPFAVGIEFSDLEWEGARAALYAELIDLDRKSAGAHRPVTYYDGHANTVLIERGIRGVGVFYIDAAGFRIPPGFHMLWRTLPASGRIEE